jgi:hypothetical protein
MLGDQIPEKESLHFHFDKKSGFRSSASASTPAEIRRGYRE